MKTARRLKNNRSKQNRRSRRGGRLFGYATNPIKAIANRTGLRKSRDQIYRENMLVGMAPVRDYQKVVNAKRNSFQQQIENIVSSEMNELKALIPKCKRECMIALQAKDPEAVAFAQTMNTLSLCTACSVPPHQIPICQDVEEKLQIIQAYIDTLKKVTKMYEDDLALLGKGKEDGMTYNDSNHTFSTENTFDSNSSF